MFGAFISWLFKSKKNYSNTVKIIGVSILYLLLLIIIIFANPKRIEGEHIIDFLFAVAIDSIVFDSIVVCLLNCNCSPRLRSYFCVRGFAEN